MSEDATETAVIITFAAGHFDIISGQDMDFYVDDRGYLSVFDYSTRLRKKQIYGAVFVAVPGHWSAVAFPRRNENSPK